MWKLNQLTNNYASNISLGLILPKKTETLLNTTPDLGSVNIVVPYVGIAYFKDIGNEQIGSFPLPYSVLITLNENQWIFNYSDNGLLDVTITPSGELTFASSNGTIIVFQNTNSAEFNRVRRPEQSNITRFEALDNTENVSHISIAEYQVPISRTFNFPINSASDCFAFYSYSLETPDIRIKNPNGTYTLDELNSELYNETIDANHWIIGRKKTEFSVPIVPNQSSPMGGAWTCKARRANPNNLPKLTVAERITFPAVESHFTLPLKLVLYANVKNRTKKIDWINQVMPSVLQIYQSAAIKLEYGEIEVHDLPSTKITDEFTDITTRDIVRANADPNKISLLFVENLSVSVRGEGGRAGGIPGPQGFINDYSAVLLKLSSDPKDLFMVNRDIFSYAIAHEIGHYLGLTHESAKKEASNLMFPRLGLKSRGILNDQQKFIIRNMPIVQIHSETGHSNPIKKIKVVIQTGTEWPSSTDGPGTDLNVRFGIGSKAEANENWYLSNWNENDFESGKTNTFELDVQNLHMEDLKYWYIQMEWSKYEWAIITYFTEDQWSFKHITIYADGVLIDDREINKVMGLHAGKRYLEQSLTL